VNYVNETYPNWPVRLYQEGAIESTAYSFYMDDFKATTGSLVFGGLDTAKYKGQMYTVPIQSFPGYGYVEFLVNATVAARDGSESEIFGGILDTGTSLTYLPPPIVQDLADQLGAQWNDTLQAYTFAEQPCRDDYLTYSFSGAKIRVKAEELTMPLQDLYSGATGDNTPIFTVFPNTQTMNITLLGDSFIRSAYVVYDLQNGQIGIAQSRWDSNWSNLVPITDAGIPFSRPAPGFSTNYWK
jgi:hypothetical protein